MKVIRLDDSGTKTPSGKLPDESRKKKRNLPAVRWSGTSEESGENAGGKGAENTAPAQRSPTYSEIMEKLWIVLVWAVVLMTAAILVFSFRRKKQQGV